MKKKFIEYDLPLKEISKESAREKNIRHGHPSTLHIWWARRPLAASRATAFAALIDDPGPKNPEKRKEIYELIKQITPWEAVKDGNSEAIKKAQQMIKDQFGDNPPKVLDPFAGGGSIPLEALRLGCETYASDLNPVAVLIEKATLEWPQKFGIEVDLPKEELKSKEKESEQLDLTGDSKKVNLLAYLVEKWAKIILEEAKKEIGRFYPEEISDNLIGVKPLEHKKGWIPVGYIWARTIPCQNPSCGTEIPLIKQFWLAKKKNKKIAYRPVVDRKNKKIDFKILVGDEIKKVGFDPSQGTVNRANATCPVCNQVTEAKRVRKLAQEGKMSERMVIVVFHHPDERGKKYRLANKKDMEVFKKTEKYLEKKIEEWPYLESPIPNELMNTNDPTTVAGRGYGIEKWRDLFNFRQQLALLIFLKEIKKAHNKIDDFKVGPTDLQYKIIDTKEFIKAVTTYLGIMLSRVLDYSSMFCRWVSQGEFMANTFGRQALPMLWDYFEVNLFSNSTGSWEGAGKWIQSYINSNNWKPQGLAKIDLSSATNLSYKNNYFEAVFTDPPYYDNIDYAELSDFFYVWLKRSVGDLFPSFFSSPLTPKSEEIVANTIRQGGQGEAKIFFEDMLGKSFQETYRVLKPGGIAIIVYAHQSTEGWETVLAALVGSGFVLTGSWPIYTERREKLSWGKTAYLASSIYMVCRKGERKKVGFWREIKPKIKENIGQKLNQFWKQGIAGGDFFISAIGPGMEEFSKYEKVEKYSGEEVSTLELLQFIRGECANFLTQKLLKNGSRGEIDNAAKFYLIYRYAYTNNSVPFDDARKIASAQGIDLDDYWKSGGFIKKAGANIKVLGPKERGLIKKIENMVDAMHLSCQLWEKGQKEKLVQVLAEAGYANKNSFWQLCQAIAECFSDVSKEKQLLEGLLMGKEQYAHSAVEYDKKIPKQEKML